MESPMKEHSLGIASRYNDADCEEHGFAHVFERLGLDMKLVLYAAEQRAIRSLAIEEPSLSYLLGNKPKIIQFQVSAKQRMRLAVLQAAVLDGILIGYRAALLDKEAQDA